jgi:hypothetical protein
MMGFTASGQVNEQMVADRDKRFGISSEDKRKNRSDIAAPPVDPGADAWQKGQTVQLSLGPVSKESVPGASAHTQH